MTHYKPLIVLLSGILLCHNVASTPNVQFKEIRREQMFDKRHTGGNNGHPHGNVNFGPATIGVDSVAMELIGSFEVFINGQMLKPDIDRSDMPVQIAQNHDHHFFTMHQHTQKRRLKRNFASVRLWDDGIIPYEIDTNSINIAERIDAIREGIKEMNDLTCLKINPRNEVSNPPHNSFLRFINNNQGCWSYVGRVSNNLQEIGLDNYCYDKSTVIHEIMHAIGMQHEQQRSDRDQYIDMIWSNIQGGQTNVNMRQEVTDDKNSYDAESLLQYGLRAFAIDNSQPSMRLKDKNLEFLPNSAKGLTFYDVKDITTGYDCTANCNPKPACANEGFVGWTCQCMCPMGLKGALCNEVDTDSDCGAIINLASGASQIIESPNYANGNHPLDKECVWLIKGPQNSKIELHIENLDLRPNTNNRCYHWLEVRYNLIGQPGPKRCGELNDEIWQTTDANINGKANLMLLKFDSRFSKDVAGNRGFRLNVTAVGGDSSPPDNCNPNPCQNNGICSLTASSYTCQCTGGFTGTNCETPPPQACDSNPCQNNGVCVNTGNTFSCQCTATWTGPTCEEAVNTTTRICTFEPSADCFLLNNYAPTLATSQTKPSAAASGSYFVAPAATGNYITLKINNSAIKLQNGQAYCFGFKYTTTRSDVQIGLYAENDTSYSKPLNVWSGVFTAWTSATFDFTASTGSNPMLDVWYSNNIGYGAVDDVTIKAGQCSSTAKPCDSSPCLNGGNCTNSGSSFTCACTTGWQGATCEQQVPSCTSSTCSNGGTCNNNAGTITCTCAPGWTGTTCADQILPCDSSPCMNGGTCTNNGNIFTCNCAQGWTGTTCTDTTTSPSLRCTFEQDAPCFFNDDFSPVQASSQTSPTQAYEGSYYVAPTGNQDYITLKINSSAVNFISGQIYCLEFYFTILSDNTEVGIYNEMDTNYIKPVQLWRNLVNWSWVRYTFTSLTGRNPMLDIYYPTGSGSGAIDNVSLKQGSC